ncbi:hypothetical protein JW911_03395 [Candidatus Peregrinibacteria bacterium]|nr:hypothetical protein [Candidatus Peregrinibacteria bacterium]
MNGQQGQTGLAGAPGSAPRSAETHEIVRRYESRKNLYPDIKTVDDLNKKGFLDLIGPLEKNDQKLPKTADRFLKNIKNLAISLNQAQPAFIDYGQAKNLDPNNPHFTNLERRALIINQRNNQSILFPNYDKLFHAKNTTELEANLNNPLIVPAEYKTDRSFPGDVKAVFNVIERMRLSNINASKTQRLYKYLDEIFKAKDKDELEKAINNSIIIRRDSLTEQNVNAIFAAKEQYDKFREWIGKQIDLESDLKKDRQTLLSKPLEYAKSAEGAAAGMIQKFRDNFAGMDGNQKLVAGATILVGLAWFLNSKNEEVGKMRDLFKKVALLGIGYFAINTTSKVFLGKSLKDVSGKYIERKAGKRNFLKSAFNTNDTGAEIMNSALINLGDHDFDEIAKLYLLAESEYRRTPIADNLREISVGGVAEENMSRNQIYRAMKMLDRKLNKSGSSIAELRDAFETKRREAELRGERYPRPTLGLIVAAALQKDIMRYKPNKEGKNIKFSRVELDSTQRGNTDDWWMVTGMPYHWKQQAYSPNKYPKKSINTKNLKHITEDSYAINKPLSDVIKDNTLGRYTAGYKALYESQYKHDPTKPLHFISDTRESAILMTSKVKVDYEAFKYPKKRNDARVASIANARTQAIEFIKKSPQFKSQPSSVQSRINEFIQPVYGVFLEDTGKEEIKEYVMFLRVTLPGSKEFELRKNKEWTDGDMLKMRKHEPMKANETLTINDFKILSAPRTTARLGAIPISTSSEFGGCYESFLARFRLNKGQLPEITAALNYYSREFAGKGISKAGLARYLSSHQFSEQEIKTATGRTLLPLGGANIEDQIHTATKDVINTRLTNISGATKKAELNEDIMSGLGNMLVLACYGDLKAIEHLKKINQNTLHATTAKTQFDSALNGIQGIYAAASGQTVPTAPGAPLVPPAAATLLPTLINYYKGFIEAAYMARPWQETKRAIDSEVEEYRKI